MNISIGIVDCEKWNNYELWLKNENIKTIKIDINKPFREQFEKCNGIVLTGGEDVHPSYYNKSEYEKDYMLNNFNPIRDEFEFNIIQEAIRFKMPILGICRGLQIVNVFFKGSLIPDLKKFNKSIHSSPVKMEVFHPIHVQQNSIGYSIIGEKYGVVNSNHHQSIDKIGESLEVFAKSEDGVIEGIGYQNKLKSLLLVQWHPERLNLSSPFSYTLKHTFINEVMKF